MSLRRATGLFAAAAMLLMVAVETSAAPRSTRRAPARAAVKSSAPRPASYRPFTGEIMPTRAIRPGMKGYGLTVFQGTKVERFDVEVISVIRNDTQLGFLGSDLIMIKMSGGPITERGANIISGMSGSPVYIDGKLIGAVSAGMYYSKEPQGFVTPIESMMEGLDEKLPEQPAYASSFMGADGRPVTLTSLMEGTALPAVMPDPTSPRFLMTPVFVNGLSPRNVARLNRALNPFGIQFASGPGGGRIDADLPFKPGSAIGVSLVTGDIDMTGIGTLTYVKGNRVLAFGHPMYGLGGVEFPMTTAYIHDVIPSMYNSIKLGSAGRIVGTIMQDRPWSIAGVIGRMPDLVDATINVHDASTGRRKTFHIQTVNHPLLSPLFTSMAAEEAILRVRNSLADTMARVRVEVKAQGLRPIVRENVAFSQMSAAGLAVTELDTIADVLAGTTKIPRVPIKSINMDVELSTGRKTLLIERAELEKDVLEPGEVARIGVTLRPWKGEPYVETLELPIPSTAPNSRTTIAISGGQSSSLLGSLTGGSSTSSLLSMLLGSTGTEETMEQAIRNRIEDRDKNNQLVAKLFLTTPSFNVAGEKLLSLPSPIADVMRSQKMTGHRQERDERKVTKDLDGVVLGVPQVLQVTIQRKSLAEKNRPVVRPTPTAPRPSTPSSGSPAPTPPPTSTTSTLPGDDEDFEEERTWLTAEELEAQWQQQEPPSRRRNRGTARPADAPPASPSGAPEPPKPAAPATPPPSSSSSDQKGPGRTATLWTQRTKQDFELGDGTGVGVTSEGDVVLVPKTEIVNRLSQEAYVWCAVPDGQGGLYLGTGNSGRIYRQDAEGGLTLFYDSPELEIHALVRDSEGNLYAGTSPNGRIYKVTPDGDASVLYETRERYVLSLALGKDGNLYAGTGPNGRIFRINKEGAGSLYFDTKEPHVLSLAFDPEGNLLAATGENGIVFRLAPNGKASVLLDSEEPNVTAIAVAKDGTAYLGTAPKGQLVKVSPGGDSRTLFAASGPIQAVVVDDEGVAYAAAGTDIYRVGTDDVITRFDSEEQNRILSLTFDDKGTLNATTGNAAATYRLTPTTTKGIYDSAIRDAGSPSRWGRIFWQQFLPEGTKITLQTRSGNSAEPDASWSRWSRPYTDPKGAQVVSPPGRFIQYRATLEGAEGKSPRLASVTLSYLTSNRPPTVSFTAPQQGEVWSGKQTVRWAASDPDRDSLTFDLYESRDGGVTWRPLKSVKPDKPASATEKTEPAKPAPKTDEKPKTVETPTAESVLAEVTREIEKDKNLTPEDRQILNAMLPEVVKAAVQIPPARPAQGSSSASSSEASKPLTETSFSWDTTEVPNGEYFLKVVVSDKRSNPGDFLTQEKILGPITINNEKPQVSVPKDAPKVAEGVVTLEGRARSSRMPILSVSYRVGDGEWYAAEPVDGVFDSPTEAFRVQTDKLDAGEKILEIKAVDTANNIGTEKVTVKVP